eukprot:jgi/Ulvmu1/10012/UM059_0061.1
MSIVDKRGWWLEDSVVRCHGCLSLGGPKVAIGPQQLAMSTLRTTMKKPAAAFVACLSAALAALLFTSPAHGHACVTDPPARLAADGPYSVMCSGSAYELSSGNCNGPGGVGCRDAGLSRDTSVCGGPFQESTWNPRDLPFRSQRTYATGDVITLTVYYRVVHTSGAMPGWVEARLCTSGSGLTQSCFDRYTLQAVGGSGIRHTVPNTQQPFQTATYAFQLPPGVSCSECVLQYTWQTSSYDAATGEQFQNCADITITGGGSNPAPSDPPPSVPPPPTPTPSPPPPSGGCDPSSVCSSPGVKPAPCGCSSDCNQFVNCAHGSGVLQPCPAGLVFDPAGFCDFAYNFDCPC